MNTKIVRIIGARPDVLATAQITQRGEMFSGLIDLSSTPAGMRQTFEEYEEIVNGQMFGALDEVQDRIDGLALKVLFEDGCTGTVTDLQVYPSTGRVSFKLAGTCARTA